MSESSPDRSNYDVLVMGGGPAGSATAARLASQGFKTLLIEKDRHPRFHIGESLLPLSIPYLSELGVLDEVEAIGLRKYAAEFHSVYHDRVTRFEFGDAMDPRYPYAFEVRRADFDHLLWNNALAKGAQGIEDCRIDQVSIDAQGIRFVSAVDGQGQRHQFKARFYIDATGRDTLLADHLGTKRRNPRHRSAAVYGHFKGASRATGRDEGNISIYWFDHGWFWMIPLKDGTMSVGAVCRPEYLKARTVPVNQFLQDTIRLSPGVSERLGGAELIGDATATGNYSYQSTRMTGKNYLMVGDAYAFIDPVFSSGVHLALHGAFKASECVASILEEPKTATARLKQYEAANRRGLNVFSWFIYRITTPAIRHLFMYPQSFFDTPKAVTSVLAGDIFGETPIGLRLMVFRLIYHVHSLLMRLGLKPAVSR